MSVWAYVLILGTWALTFPLTNLAFKKHDAAFYVLVAILAFGASGSVAAVLLFD